MLIGLGIDQLDTVGSCRADASAGSGAVLLENFSHFYHRMVHIKRLVRLNLALYRGFILAKAELRAIYHSPAIKGNLRRS